MILFLCHLKGELVSTPLDKDGTHNGQEKAPNFLGRPFFFSFFLIKLFFLNSSLDNKSGRQSMSSNPSKPGPESDTDSMAEYGEGEPG